MSHLMQTLLERLAEMFPEPSRPGPMSGGADVDTKSKKFSHGLEW